MLVHVAPSTLLKKPIAGREGPGDASPNPAYSLVGLLRSITSALSPDRKPLLNPLGAQEGTGTVTKSAKSPEQFLKPMKRKRKSRHDTQERQGIRFESSKAYSRHANSPLR
jgi:hypothetical protein